MQYSLLKQQGVRSATILIMFIISFFSWWYGKGWVQVLESFKPRLVAVMNLFSVQQLLKTMFAPWRRIISYPGASLGDKFRAWGDNLFSRTIGFFVRLFVLFSALLISMLIMVITAIELVVWPALPPAIFGCLVVGALL